MKKIIKKIITTMVAISLFFVSFAYADVASFDPSQYSDEELQKIQEIITNELYERKQAWVKEHGDRKISFENYELTIARGKTEKVIATITRNIDTAPEKTNLIWTSDDESVATVKDGSIQAKGVGNCLITCHADDNEFINSAIAVTVFEPVKSIKSDVTQATVAIGSYIIPNISFDPENATYKDIEWTSSDETIAEVSSSFGRIVALDKGDCVISAKATDGSEKKVDIKIHVPAFAIAEEEYHFSESDGITIPIVYSGITYSDIKVSGNNDAKIITWSLDNSGIKILPKRKGDCTLTISYGKDKKTISIYNEINSLKANESLNPGDVVILGMYEQDADTGNGKEPIEWDIEEISGQYAILSSVKIIDAQPFDKNKRSGLPLSSSSLGQWLNGTFKKVAFTADEQEALVGDISLPGYTFTSQDAQEASALATINRATGDIRVRKNSSRVKSYTAYSKQVWEAAKFNNSGILKGPANYWCADSCYIDKNGATYKGDNIRNFSWGIVPVIMVDLTSIVLPRK